jgi:hypothetical protein
MRRLRRTETPSPQFGHQKLSLDSVSRIIIAAPNTGQAMQDREPSSLGSTHRSTPGSIRAEEITSGRSPEQADLWELSRADRDTASSPIPVAQKEIPAPHVAEAKPSIRSEGARRTASSADPVVTGSIPRTMPSPRLLALGAAPTTLNAQAAALAPKQPLVAAPDTRPSTIPGWSVVEVRDGTAVLEGPEGVRMAARGDTIPGIGRVDSIVRWGNRWIVATASGLIATP